ncbi:MAG: hypothetical protein Q9207_004226 [Kuettlingeria erythrocarpa]
MESPSIESGHHPPLGSQLARDLENGERTGKRSDLIRAHSDVTGRGSPQEHEERHDDGHIATFTRMLVEMFLRPLTAKVKGDQTLSSLPNGEDESEKPAVAGSTEPALDSLFDSDRARRVHHHNIDPTIVESFSNIDHVSSPSASGHHTHGPKSQVKVLDDSTVVYGTGLRRCVRREWRTDSSIDRLLDPWKHLWPPEGGGMGIGSWLCDDTERQELQLDLVDALTSGRPDPFVERIMRKDYRAIASWVLERCYNRKVLEQPIFEVNTDVRKWRNKLSSHVYSIRTAIYLVGLLFKHNMPCPMPHEDLDQVWTMPLNEVEQCMRQTPRDLTRVPRNEGKADFFFGGDDLTLKELQRLGHLHINWTSHWDEHLRLDVNGTVNVLYLYWFEPRLTEYFPAT